MDAEHAHEFTLEMLATSPGLWSTVTGLSTTKPAPSLHRSIAGLQFRSPIGLAAGLDKNGVAIPFWPSLGFGFIEVGTVTAHPQSGNPKPRMFRLPKQQAIINRMGFNNLGSEALALRLRGLKEAGQWPTVPVGANIGKSKITELEDAPADYVISTKRLAGLADYFTVNVSSPNTPGLRSLQDRSTLQTLLPQVQEAAGSTPVFLKLAPDLGDEAIEDAVSLAIELGIDALIATNTTVRRDLLTEDPGEAGGLSGAPLFDFAKNRIQVALAAAGSKLPVIGVGGVDSPEKAQELLDLGCVAVQLYTGLIYEGPGLPARMNAAIARR